MVVVGGSLRVDLESLKTAITIGSKGNALFLLPDLNVALDGIKSKHLLLHSELTVLTESVKANDILLVFGAEVIKYDIRELLRNHLVDLFLFHLGDSTLIFFLSDILCLLLLLNALPVGYGLSKRFVEETALVNERDGHERSESRDTLEVHAGFSDDLLDVVVLETVHQFQLSGGLNAVFIDRGLSGIKSGVVFTEDIVGNADSRLQDSAFDELVVLARVNELNDFRGFIVEMSFVISVNLDLELWVLEAANIDTSRSGVFLQEVDEGGQVVSQILRFFKSCKESGLVLLFLLLCLNFFLSTALSNGHSSLVTLLLVRNSLELLFSL